MGGGGDISGRARTRVLGVVGRGGVGESSGRARMKAWGVLFSFASRGWLTIMGDGETWGIGLGKQRQGSIKMWWGGVENMGNGLGGITAAEQEQECVEGG